MSGHCRPPSGRSGESALACCGMIDVCMWAAVISSAGLRGEWLVGAREPAVPLVSCLAEISGSRRHKWTALTTSCLNQPVFVAERARGVVLSDINAPIRARGPHGAIALCAWVCMEVAV